MYSDSLSGDNDDAKYYDKWRVGVPMLEIIGRINTVLYHLVIFYEFYEKSRISFSGES